MRHALALPRGKRVVLLRGLTLHVERGRYREAVDCMSMATSFRRPCVLRPRPKAKSISLRFFTAFRMTSIDDVTLSEAKGLSPVE
jgi:hypothetical protein